ncbi:MAG: Na+/H+ antiporter subunit E [Turicibacter sp.]|nr:Na+/H+ antiporter subunit E [Turicibacter sp.]
MLRNHKIVDHIRLIILFTIIYVILNERLTWLTVSLGVASGFAAIMLTNKILEIDYVEMFHINLWLVLTYFWIIIRDTYTAGFDVLLRTLKGNVTPNVITYKSQLQDEMLLVLLANAITMPPGAITVDREGDEMTILTVGYAEEEFLQTTHEKIEKLLGKFDSGIGEV